MKWGENPHEKWAEARTLARSENAREKGKKKKLLVSVCRTNLAKIENAKFINKTTEKEKKTYKWRRRHSPQY